MLKELLDKFDQVEIVDFITDKNGKKIAMRQLFCNQIERIFNNNFIEMRQENPGSITVKIIMDNSPENIEIKPIDEHKKSIKLTYRGREIDLIGHKKI